MARDFTPLRAAATGIGRTLLGTATLVLVIHFTASSGAGRSVVAAVVEGDLNGAASIGNIIVDPLTGMLAMADLKVTDRDNAPVAEVGAIAVVPSAVTETDIESLLVDKACVTVRIDEEGRTNLDDLFREKETKKPSAPSLFRISDIDVDESSLVVTTPFADLTAGPVTLNGTHVKEVDGTVSGSCTTSCGKLVVKPRVTSIADYFRKLTGADDLELGPLDASVEWTRDRVRVQALNLEVPGASVFVRADVDVNALGGELAVAVRSGGAEVATFTTRVAEKEWFVSALVNHFCLPGGEVAGLMLPDATLDGFIANASENNFSLTLDRFLVENYSDEGLSTSSLSVSAGIRFVPKGRMSDLYAQVDSASSLAEAFRRVIREWSSGEITLALLAEDLFVSGSAVASPLRLKVHAMPTKERGAKLEAQLSVHPLGSVQGEVTVTAPDRKGDSGYSARLWTDGLDLVPLSPLLDLPPMARKLLNGKLVGQATFSAAQMESPTVRFQSCRFETTAEDGGGLVLQCAAGDQDFDFSKEPDVSFLKKEIAFGTGRMTFQVKPAPRRDGR